MKKVLLLLLFILASFFNLEAQTTQEEEVQIKKDSIEMLENFERNKTESCLTPFVHSEAVVRYRNSAVAYFKFESREDAGRFNFTLRSEEREEKGEFNIEGNELTISNLPLNQTFELLTTNSCGNEARIAIIKTDGADLGVVKVSSQELFDLVTDWSENKRGTEISLNKLVYNAPNISKYEKLAFIQDYFLGDSLIDSDDNPIDGNDTGGGTTGSGGGKTDCKCKVLQFIPRSFSSTGDDGQNLLVVGDDAKDDNGKFQWTQTAAYKGPAKNIELDGLGKRISGANSRTYGVKDNNAIATSPTMAFIQYALVCVGNYTDPKECECERDIAIAYRYDTRLSASTAKGSCWLCAKKEAGAKAEDWAAFVIEKNGSLKVVDVKGAMAKGQCEMVVNKEFIVGVIGITATIATTIATGGATAPLIAALEPQVKALAQGQIFDVNKCDQEEFTKTLISGTENVTLKPGEKVIARLYSFSAQQVEGYNSWRANTKIKSNFLLAGVAIGGKKGTSPYCCMPNRADWISSSMGGPWSDPIQRNYITTFYHGYGVWNPTLNVSSDKGGQTDDWDKYCKNIEGIQIR